MSRSDPPDRRAPTALGAAASYLLLVGATVMLVLYGVVMVLSASAVESIAQGLSPYAVASGQAAWALVGLILLWIASRIPARVYRRMAGYALIAALIVKLLVYTPLGLSHGGHRSWIRVGPVIGQPAEALKLGLALWLGAVLASRQSVISHWQSAVLPAVPGAVVAIGLVLVGHDVGTSLVMLALVGGALFIAGVPMRVFGVAAGAAAAGFGALAVTAGFRMQRIQDWLSGECDATAGCYQTTQGTRALGSGGWMGLGLGQSRQKWSYLPEAHNDFIMAIIGEELGLAGTLLVLFGFGVLAFAMFRVIARHPDPFARITTAAVLMWLLGQALINIGTVVGLVPVIGVPLPLISAGGSAMVTSLLAVGVVASFARTEPGALEALTARPGALRRGAAVLARRSAAP